MRFLARIVQESGNKPRLAVISLSADKELLSISPFISETAHTAYYDGLLLITSPSLTISEIETFVSSSSLINELVESSLYRQHQVACGDKCRIYHISHIDWKDLRFTKKSVVSVVVK